MLPFRSQAAVSTPWSTSPSTPTLPPPLPLPTRRAIARWRRDTKGTPSNPFATPPSSPTLPLKPKPKPIPTEHLLLHARRELALSTFLHHNLRQVLESITNTAADKDTDPFRNSSMPAIVTPAQRPGYHFPSPPSSSMSLTAGPSPNPQLDPFLSPIPSPSSRASASPGVSATHANRSSGSGSGTATSLAPSLLLPGETTHALRRSEARLGVLKGVFRVRCQRRSEELGALVKLLRRSGEGGEVRDRGLSGEGKEAESLGGGGRAREGEVRSRVVGLLEEAGAVYELMVGMVEQALEERKEAEGRQESKDTVGGLIGEAESVKEGLEEMIDNVRLLWENRAARGNWA